MNPLIQSESMIRVLKPSTRPFIVFSVMFGLLLCLPLALGLLKGMWLDAAKASVCLLVIYGFLCIFVMGSRVSVSSDFIVFCSAFIWKKTVLFKDVEISIPFVLAESEHPISVSLFADSGKRTKENLIVLTPLLEIPLKSFAQKDVAWLLSRPELRIQDKDDGHRYEV